MKQLFLLTLTAACWVAQARADDGMKQSHKEAQKETRKQLAALQEQLSSQKREVSQDDLLPLEVRGQQFDPKSSDIETSELENFLSQTKKEDPLELEESFIVESGHIIQNPLHQTGITSLKTVLIPEEERLEKCQENGTYQVAFLQTLSVDITAEIREEIKHCQGHTKSKSYDSVKKAKHNVSVKKEELENSADILSYEVHRDEKKVICLWRHKDNSALCDHFSIESKIAQEGKEKEFWKTDQPEGLALIESNPFCKLLYTKTIQGPESRLVNNQAVYRDVWSRRLFFSCEADSNSKCAQLRRQGGILIAKKCLEQNELGECDLVEKTYDLGKRGALEQTTATFNGSSLWGMNNIFDTSYNKNLDFGQTLATLSVFSDLESNLESHPEGDFHDKIEIFKGGKFKCSKSFIEGNVFDCCKKMDGLAVHAHLANCKEEEKCLALNRQEGKCRFIGSQKIKLGSVTEHVYCCFPTKLARVIQEQGRDQLGLKWGSAEKPKCRGLTLEELQKIDFGKVDLSEVVDDIKVDKQHYRDKLEKSIESLKLKIETPPHEQKEK